MCDNECEGCERPQDVYCLELNERREEKVKGKLAGGSGLLSNDDGWGKARGRRRRACWVPCRVLGVPSSLAWDGRVSGREEWMLIHFLAAGLLICLDPSRSKAPEARSDSGKQPGREVGSRD